MISPDVFAQSTKTKALYEPNITKLSGTIVRKTFPGPPNYNSIAEGDTPETGWYLKLNGTLDVQADKKSDLNNVDERDVKDVQLVLDSTKYKKWQKLVGKSISVKATGTLFHSHTGHHHTAVLMDVQNIEKQ